MRKIIVSGGRHLMGDVTVGGSKNAALPILFGGIVTGGECVFYNLPRVSDVLTTLEILRFLGARITFLKNGAVSVDYAAVRPEMPPPTLTSAIRGSVYLLGAMLARFGEARLGGAGGCDFGSRPIDQHIMGFCAMGADVKEENGALAVRAPDGLRGGRIRLAMPSVGATANLMLAAVLANGETVIENAAAEPHVAALSSFLRDAGARIEKGDAGAWKICGGAALHGVKNTIIPDMIEAGTYLALGMACGGPVRVRAVEPADLTALTDAFSAMGGRVEIGENYISVASAGTYRGVDIETGPYPAFPTDLHPQIAALFSIGGRAVGRGSVTERVWQSRFRYTEELSRMGAKVEIDGERAVFTPAPLHATRLHSPDLRGGAALLIAALATRGQSEICGAVTIGRGYEHLESKLSALGAAVHVE